MSIEPISVTEIQEVCDDLQRYIALPPERQIDQPHGAYRDLTNRAARVLLIAASGLNYRSVRDAAHRFFADGNDLSNHNAVYFMVVRDILPSLAKIVHTAEDERGFDENYVWWALNVPSKDDDLQECDPPKLGDVSCRVQLPKAIACGFYYVLRFVLKQRAASVEPTPPDIPGRAKHDDTHTPKRAPNATEQAVLDLLYREQITNLGAMQSRSAGERPTQTWLAPRSIGRDADGQFKATLSHMKDFGWLDNGRYHGVTGGYFLTENGAKLATSQSGPSQD